MMERGDASAESPMAPRSMTADGPNMANPYYKPQRHPAKSVAIGLALIAALVVPCVVCGVVGSMFLGELGVLLMLAPLSLALLLMFAYAIGSDLGGGSSG